MQVQELVDFVRANANRKITVEQKPNGKVYVLLASSTADSAKQIFDGIELGKPEFDSDLIESLPRSFAECAQLGG